MTQFKLFLFGPPRLEHDGAAIELHGRKVWALLAYLAVTGQAQSRDRLAVLLWPEHSQSTARANLRRELSRLNAFLGDDELQIEREQITLRRAAGLWLDVTEFLALVQECPTPTPQELSPACLLRLQEAVALYTADFLAGFTLSDSPEFDEWQFHQSETLRQALAAALECLVYSHRTQSQFEPAIAYARRWLALDLLHEPVHRHLMELYALAGQRALALRQYAECQRVLSEELGVAPDDETQALAEAIRTKRFPAVSPAEATSTIGQSGAPPADAVSAPSRLPSPHAHSAAPPFMTGEDVHAATPGVFVGRGRELAELEVALATARTARGQILLVIGGAGQGKTALVQEFARRAQAADADLLVASGYCNAHTGIGDPYLPFREALALLAGDVEAKWAGGLITAPHARRLWQAMPITVAALVEQAPDLVGAFVPANALRTRAATFAPADAAWFSRLAAQADDDRGAHLEEKQLFRQYTAALKTIAARRPLLLILEDLHWADTSSSGLLFHLSREMGDSRILLVGTYRPDELVPGQSAQTSMVRHPLASLAGELKRQHGDIWLDLGKGTLLEGRQFVDDYLDTQPNRLGEAFRTALFRQTGGHALFTVELLAAMQERGDLRQDESGRWIEGEAINWQSLPAKVEGVIEKRIARLDAASQTLLRVASVEGELFTAEVVARVQQLDERGLVQRLSHDLDREHRLVTAQSVEALGGQRLSHYRFRHYLFQHYLYHSLDQVERAYLHEAVGLALEALYGEQRDQVAVHLARHFEHAGLTAKAVVALLLAGQLAQQLGAYQEATHHLSKGLALLKTLPDTPEHVQLELDLQIALGYVLSVTQGPSAIVVENAFLAARALCRQLGDTAKLWPVVIGQFFQCAVQAKLLRCHELGEELLALSQGRPELEPHLWAHTMLGLSLLQLGEFLPSIAHLEQVLAIDHARRQRDLAIYHIDYDHWINSLAYLAIDQWLLGFPDQALRHNQEMLTVAATAGTHDQVEALHYSAWLHQLRREEWIVRTRSEAVLRLATEHQFPFWLGHAILYEGCYLVEQGQAQAGVARMHEGMSAMRSAGQALAESYHLSLLAKGYAALGQSQAGLEFLDQALAFAEQSSERWCEAELHRLKGELLQMQAAPADEVAACYWQAIDVARRQQARSWELRATMSLCRLRQQQGKSSEARQMLTEIYGWFTEGFDTPDLQDAKALLDQLLSA